MTKRQIERKLEALEATTDGGGSGILIMVKGDDGEITHPDGEPITEEEYESAGIVIDYVSDDVAETWPENGDDDSEETQA